MVTLSGLTMFVAIRLPTSDPMHCIHIHTPLPPWAPNSWVLQVWSYRANCRLLASTTLDPLRSWSILDCHSHSRTSISWTSLASKPLVRNFLALICSTILNAPMNATKENATKKKSCSDAEKPIISRPRSNCRRRAKVIGLLKPTTFIPFYQPFTTCRIQKDVVIYDRLTLLKWKTKTASQRPIMLKHLLIHAQLAMHPWLCVSMLLTNLEFPRRGTIFALFYIVTSLCTLFIYYPCTIKWLHTCWGRFTKKLCSCGEQVVFMMCTKFMVFSIKMY